MTLVSRDRCTGCSACMNVCPKKAIAMLADEEGFLQPQIETSLCVECGRCRDTCPVLTVPVKSTKRPECYAFKTRDRELLRASSSGGAFSELALPVIRSGGAVFGCVMEEPDFVAHHVMADSESALAAMRGSKYVQSDVQDSFTQCKRELDRGRQVLFSGTSCQIAGLKAFLGKEYSNLLTVDFICHGVPSPAVWRKYLVSREKEVKGKVNCISFRNKHYSWKKFSLSLSFDNNKLNLIDPLGQDLYFKAFIGNYCLRKCCYKCVFKPGQGGISDITMADFWGIEEVNPEFFDEMGVSAVIVHTDKGTQIFEQMINASDFISVELDDITHRNPSYFEGVVEPEGRDFFMRHFRHVKSFRMLLQLSVRHPLRKWFWGRILRTASGIIKK